MSINEKLDSGEKPKASLVSDNTSPQPLEDVFLAIMKQLSNEQKLPYEIANDIVKMAAELVKADVCTWFRITSDRQKLILAGAHGTKGSLVPDMVYDLPWDQKDDTGFTGVTPWLAVRSEEFSANSFMQLHAHRAHVGRWDKVVWAQDRPDNDIKWFGVPIRLADDKPPKESVIGVLKVERISAEPFTDYDKYVIRLMARYIALTLEYRTTMTNKFLRQVGHPLWGAIGTIMNHFKDCRQLCTDLIASKLTPDQKSKIMDLEHIIEMGIVHTSYVNRSMTSVKELVLGSTSTRESDKKTKTNLVDVAKNVVDGVKDFIDVQSKVFETGRNFDIELKAPSNITFEMSKKEEMALRTMINELLYNAFKHARSGNSAILSLKQENSSVVIEVRDFGGGIKKEILDLIFEEGFHTDAPGAPEGVGFGLTMLRAVAQNLGWSMPEVRCQDIGVSFIIRIPFDKRGNQ